MRPISTTDASIDTGAIGTDAQARVATERDDQGLGEPVSTDIPRNRSRSRDSLFLVAQLQLGTERNVREVRVRNLSEGGLMLELDKIVEVGTAVRLDLRGIGETSGKVAWCTAGRMGIALDSPIDPKKARKPVGGSGAAPSSFHAKALDRS